MSFGFQYSKEIDSKSLYQGDLLIKNEALTAALAQAHGYYASQPSYSHLMVLTQSCDLVRRGAKNRPKTKYITLAAARPLSVVIDRELAKARFSNTPEFPITLCDAARRILIRQILERLLHNTENGHFFFRAKSHDAIDSDLCVFLALSVAVHVDHYEACLQAKVLQLEDVFQAKVGWLVGNIYSRVGTPDFEEHTAPDLAETIKEEFYKVALTRTAWLTPPQMSKLKTSLKRWQTANPGAQLTDVVAEDLVNAIPSQHDIIVDRVIELLTQQRLLGAEAAMRAANVLKGDEALKKHIRYSNTGE